MQSINPVNGEVIHTYTEMPSVEAEHRIKQCHEAFLSWRKYSIEKRADRVHHAATLLKERKSRYARLMTEEMGKHLREAEAEIEKCAWVFEYYATHAVEFLSDTPVKTEMAESFITYQPLGVVLAVMPWNFPFWQVFRFAAPALMAGNGALLKHASNVCGCALAIEEVFSDAGFPKALFSTLLIPGKRVEEVITHPLVKAVTLTGSTEAGRSVAAMAGRCLKKSVLELGGSDPYLILEDADLDKAVTACVKSRLINNGQSCIAAKRFIVVEAVYEAFVQAFTAQMEAIKMGDPTDNMADIGPQASLALRDALHRQVTESVKAGARCLIGGHIPEEKGAWYPPTVLVDVQKGMPAYAEELFGPVAAIIRVKDTEEAIAVANDTAFGLGSGIFSEDIKNARRIARDRIIAGATAVNDFVKSDPRLPFGGVGESGYGRELSVFGIREFVNIKAVTVGA
ncbi:MAG: NAD-dependent succinate-semialdehyde dehydrogenase [Hyphomicrobiales bacterium]|nr:NAD-dependent succinate-semialdehyde dehydrogenase [Hyphomicrobiales bacterium]